jgi:hypothetical protein
MKKKVTVKKHIRDGVEVEAHERIVNDAEEKNLASKIKLASETKKKNKCLQNLFFCKGKKWGDDT